MKTNYEYDLLNICTDGDPTRRLIMNGIMKFDVDDDFPWFKEIDNLPLVDYVAGPGGVTTNFDPKYMAKRLWRMLLSEKTTINGIAITKIISLTC